MNNSLNIIGSGLAGSEAAWQAANAGVNVTIYEMPEGIKVKIKDKMYFAKGSTKVDDVSVKVLDKLVSLMKENPWKLFIEGNASRG